jgi:hypothetical protein
MGAFRTEPSLRQHLEFRMFDLTLLARGTHVINYSQFCLKELQWKNG